MTTLLSVLRANPSMQSVIVPVLESMQQRAKQITRILQQPVLPPPDDTVRNPLHISHKRVEAEATQEATQMIANQMRTGNPFEVPLEELQKTEGYEHYDPQEHGDFPDIASKDNAKVVFTAQKSYVLTENNRNIARRVREDRIQEQAGKVATLKDGLAAHKKQKSGAIDEFTRGQISQLLQEHGATVPENKQLDYHISRFLEYQQRRYATKKITAGRLGKIINTLKRYKDWTGITNVERIATREHIADYHRSLEDLVIDSTIQPEYANNLFGTFRMLVIWLAKAGILKERVFTQI